MLKSVSSLLLFVKNPKESCKFYAALGFEKFSENESSCTAKLNWFKILLQDETKVKYTQDSGVEPKGAGVFIYLSTDDVDLAHKTLIDKGLTPSSLPTDQPWGNREFGIKDPDGYKLVFSTPLK